MGWASKNDQIVVDALTALDWGPRSLVTLRVSGGPPGQVWPAPLIVYSSTVAPPAQPVYAVSCTVGLGIVTVGVLEQESFAAHRWAAVGTL